MVQRATNKKLLVAQQTREIEAHAIDLQCRNMDLQYRQFSAHLDYAEMLRRNLEVIKGIGADIAGKNDLMLDCITRLITNNKLADEALVKLQK